VTRSRFPSSVYGVGDEPDPRFSLANERTFLAWIRTALALLAVGIGVAALATPIHPVLRFVAALAFIALALLAAVTAWLSWSRDERALRTGGALHGPTTGLVVVVGVVAASVVLVIGMFV
jgi:putative membrane protein